MSKPTLQFSSECSVLLKQHPFPHSTSTPLIQHPRLLIPSYDDICAEAAFEDLADQLGSGQVQKEGDLQILLAEALGSMSAKRLANRQLREVTIQGPCNLADLFCVSGQEWSNRLEISLLRQQFDKIAEEKVAAKPVSEGIKATEAAQAGPRVTRSTKAAQVGSTVASSTEASQRLTRTSTSTKAAKERSVRGQKRLGDPAEDTRGGKRPTGFTPDPRTAFPHPPLAGRSAQSSQNLGHFLPDINAVSGRRLPKHVSLTGDIKFDKGAILESSHGDGLHQVLFYVRIARSYSGNRLGVLFCNGCFQRLIILDDDHIALESTAAEQPGIAAAGHSPHPALSIDELGEKRDFWEASLPNSLLDGGSKFHKQSFDRLIHFTAVALYIGAQLDPPGPAGRDPNPENNRLKEAKEAPLQKISEYVNSSQPTSVRVKLDGTAAADASVKKARYAAQRSIDKRKRSRQSKGESEVVADQSLLEDAQNQENPEDSDPEAAAQSDNAMGGPAGGGDTHGVSGEGNGQGGEDEGGDGRDNGYDGDGGDGGDGGGGGNSGNSGDGVEGGMQDDDEGEDGGVSSTNSSVAQETTRIKDWLSTADPTPDGPFLPNSPPDSDDVDVDVEPSVQGDAESYLIQKLLGGVQLHLVTPMELDQLVFHLSIGQPLALENLVTPVQAGVFCDNPEAQAPEEARFPEAPLYVSSKPEYRKFSSVGRASSSDQRKHRQVLVG